MRTEIGVVGMIIVAVASSAMSQTAALSKSSSPNEIARAAFRAHGGTKLKSIKSLVVKGGVTVTVQTQSLPGAFSTVISGEKYVLDIQTPFQSIKQSFDGERTVSSINGILLPPVTSLGFPLLPRLDDEGYSVQAVPGVKGKRTGFRLTAPDGFYTDFYVDERTHLIKMYESAYEMNGRKFTTAIEIDKSRVVDGITVPEQYAQRFDLGQLTAYAHFKAREIIINSEIDQSFFSWK